MTKKLFLILLAVTLSITAGTAFSQDMKTTGKATKSMNIDPVDFPDKAGDMVGQEVEIEGLVVHVCKHGGKKMFIVGENPDIRVKIDASDKVTVFSADLEGSTVHVKGIVEEMAVEEVPEEEKQAEDAEHTNYYHKKQHSISCLAYKVID